MLAIEYVHSYDAALIEITPFLSGALLNRGIVAILGIADERDQLEAVAALTPHQIAGQLSDVLKAIPESMKDSTAVKLLNALIHNQSKEAHQSNLRRVLNLVLAFEHEWERADALAVLIPHSDDSLLAQILNAASGLADSWSREKVLKMLVPRLRPDLLANALEAAISIPNELYRGWALSNVAPYLSDDDLLQRYLDAILTIEDYEDNRTWMIAEVAPRLTGKLLDRGLNLAHAIEDDSARIAALVAFLPVIASKRPTEQKSLVREIRQLIVTNLQATEHESHDSVLRLVKIENLFAPPVMSEETISAIIDQLLPTDVP